MKLKVVNLKEKPDHIEKYIYYIMYYVNLGMASNSMLSGMCALVTVCTSAF